jgi:hypothetical protein
MKNKIIKTQYSDHIKYTLNGECHREDGPALEFHNRSKYWFINGKYHREDGPAIEYANGSKYWFINGKELSEDEFNQYLLQRNLSKI